MSISQCLPNIRQSMMLEMCTEIWGIYLASAICSVPFYFPHSAQTKADFAENSAWAGHVH